MTDDPKRPHQLDPAPHEPTRPEEGPEQAPSSPRIVVDDDWKEQIRKEREALKAAERQRRQAEETPLESSSRAPRPDASPPDASASDASPPDASPPDASPPDARGGATSAGTPGASNSEDSGLPPASFSMLVSSLATQVLAALGLLPDEQGKSTEPMWDVARHLIDTLAMLERKTQGNLDAQESRLLGQALHDLRMAFVQTRQSGAN